MRDKWIGVDLGASNLRSGLVVEGKLDKHFMMPLPCSKGKKAVISAIEKAIEKVYEDNIQGIGIGVPSVVDRKKGIVYHVQNIPSWKKVFLKDLLQEKFKKPVFVNNDANCFALGERHFGKGKPYQNFVGLAIGTGVAGGIIQNGRLLHDAHCGSGEFGEMPYLDSKFEDYCSGLFFINRHGEDGKVVFEKYAQGDAHAEKVVREFSTHLGKLIKSVILAIDPEAIILGGSVAQSGKWFHPLMMEEINKFPYPKILKSLKILYASQPKNQVLGAAYLGKNLDKDAHDFNRA